MHARVALFALVAASACTGEDPLFPSDYASTYTEVRDCRSSSDHDLHRIRVLTDPAALAPYTDRQAPFPVGSVVLKEEHDFADTDCSGPVIEWTVMRKTRESDDLGWSWQKVDGDSTVSADGTGRCVNCHTSCGVAPDGYDGTCTMP